MGFEDVEAYNIDTGSRSQSQNVVLSSLPPDASLALAHAIREQLSKSEKQINQLQLELKDLSLKIDVLKEDNLRLTMGLSLLFNSVEIAIQGEHEYPNYLFKLTTIIMQDNLGAQLKKRLTLMAIQSTLQ